MSDQLGQCTQAMVEVTRRIAKIRDQWLSERFRELGALQEWIDDAHSENTGLQAHGLRWMQRWVLLRGISVGYPALNRIQLFEHGELIYDETLFELPAESSGEKIWQIF